MPCLDRRITTARVKPRGDDTVGLNYLPVHDTLVTKQLVGEIEEKRVPIQDRR